MKPEELPFKLNTVILDKEKHGAYDLKKRIDELSKQTSSISLTPDELNLQFEVEVVTKEASWIVDEAKVGVVDFWFWQIEGDGESHVTVVDDSNGQQLVVQEYKLKRNDSVLIQPKSLGTIRAQIINNGQLLKVTQDPNRKKLCPS